MRACLRARTRINLYGISKKKANLPSAQFVSMKTITAQGRVELWCMYVCVCVCVYAERKITGNTTKKTRKTPTNRKNTQKKNTPQQEIATRRAHTGEGNHTTDGGGGKRVRKIKRAGGKKGGRALAGANSKRKKQGTLAAKGAMQLSLNLHARGRRCQDRDALSLQLAITRSTITGLPH